MAAITIRRSSGAPFLSADDREKLWSGTSFNLFLELAIFRPIRFAFQSVSKSGSCAVDVAEGEFGLSEQEMGLRILRLLLEGFAEVFLRIGRVVILQSDHAKVVQ